MINFPKTSQTSTCASSDTFKMTVQWSSLNASSSTIRPEGVYDRRTLVCLCLHPRTCSCLASSFVTVQKDARYPPSIILFLFCPDPENKKKGKWKHTFFIIFFLHSSAFQLTKIHIYANMRHLFPPLPHMGDGSQARINDIASAVMFAAFH